MKIETKAVIITSIIFYFLGYMILDSALRAQPDSWGYKSLGLLINSFKWAIAGAFIALSYFQLKKKRILLAIILVPICLFLTYGDVYKLFRYENYLRFAKASATGQIPLDPLIEKWKNGTLGYGEIRGIDLALNANVDVSVSNLEYVARRCMDEYPKQNLILQEVIEHKSTPESLLRTIYEFIQEDSKSSLCSFGYHFVDSSKTPTDILKDLANICDGVVARDAQRRLGE